MISIVGVIIADSPIAKRLAPFPDVSSMHAVSGCAYSLAQMEFGNRRVAVVAEPVEPCGQFLCGQAAIILDPAENRPHQACDEEIIDKIEA